jgi:hypothetical protein
MASAAGNMPTATWDFLAPTASVTIAAGQKLHVISTQMLGSTVGAGDLDLDICYQLEGGNITKTSNGLSSAMIPAHTRLPFATSGIIADLPAGTYAAGLCGTTTSAGWDWAGLGSTTVLIFN